MWIGCLGPLIAFLMVFDRSKQILNSFLASLIVMSLYQAFGSDFRHIFPSHFILSSCSFILAFIFGILGDLPQYFKFFRWMLTSSLKNPLQRDRSRAGWKRYVWMRKNQTCVVQVSVPVAKGCLGRARSRLLAAELRLQMGVWKCSGTMWCSTSMDFICRDLNPYQLCTVWARREKWLAFYP